MNSNYSNGLQNEFLITPKGTTKVKNLGAGKLFAAKNRGTKPYTTTATATAVFSVVVIPATNLPSSSTSVTSFPYTVTDANSVSYAITKMISTYPGNSTWNYYIPADNNGNLFLFGDISNYGTISYNSNNSIGSSYTSTYAPTLTSFPGPTSTTIYTLVPGFLQSTVNPTGYANIYQLVTVPSS